MAFWEGAAFRRLVNDMPLVEMRFDGCMYGLEAQFGPFFGEPIDEPWHLGAHVFEV